MNLQATPAAPLPEWLLGLRLPHAKRSGWTAASATVVSNALGEHPKRAYVQLQEQRAHPANCPACHLQIRTFLADKKLIPKILSARMDFLEFGLRLQYHHAAPRSCIRPKATETSLNT